MKTSVRRLIAGAFIVALPSLSFAQTPGGGGVGVVLSGDATATSGGAVTYKGGVLATNPAIGMVSGTTDNSPLVSTLLLALTNPAPGALGGGGNAIFPAVQGMDKTPYYFSKAVDWTRQGSVSCQNASSGPRQEGVNLVFAAGVHGFVNNSGGATSALATAFDLSPGNAQLSGCSLWSLGYGTATSFTAGNATIPGQLNAGFGAIPATVWGANDGFLAYGKIDAAYTAPIGSINAAGTILTVNTGYVGAAATPTYAGTGNGTLTMDATAPLQTGFMIGTYTVLFSSSTAFTVKDPGGIAIANGTVGTVFSNQIKFNTTQGGTLFVNGDQFSIVVSKSNVVTSTGTGVVTMDATTPTLASAIAGKYKITWPTSAATFNVTDPNGAVLDTGIANASSYAKQIKFAVSGSPAIGDEVDVTNNFVGITSPTPPWVQSTTYSSGTNVTAGANIYTETVASCTSASSGTGPTGTGSGIADNTCSWNFVKVAPISIITGGSSFSGANAQSVGLVYLNTSIQPYGTLNTTGRGGSGTYALSQAQGSLPVPAAGAFVARSGNSAANGTIVKDTVTPVLAGAIPGMYRVVFTDATHFTVTDPNGVGVAGSPFLMTGSPTTVSVAAQLKFVVTSGGTVFAANDEYDITLTSLSFSGRNLWWAPINPPGAYIDSATAPSGSPLTQTLTLHAGFEPTRSDYNPTQGAFDWRLPADHAFTIATTGTARLSGNATTGAVTVLANASSGVYRVIWTAATTFQVFEPSGALVTTGSNGVAFSNQIGFTATAGATPQAIGDELDITVTLPSTAAGRAANGGTATIVLDSTTPVLTGATAGVYRVVFTGASAFTVTDPKGVVLAGTTSPFANQLMFTLGGGSANVGDEIDVQVNSTTAFTMVSGASGDTALKMTPGDFLWTPAFNFGCVVYTEGGPAGAQTGLAMISTFMTTTSTACQALKIGTFSAWIIPMGQKGMGQIYSDNNYFYGFPIGLSLMSSSGDTPPLNNTHSVITRNSFESGIVATIDGGNNTGASDFNSNEGIHQSLADFVFGGTVGSGYHDINSNSAEESNAPVGIMENCTNPNSSVIFGSYIGTPPPSAAACMDVKGNIGLPTVYGSGRLIIGSFGGAPTDTPTLNYNSWLGPFRIGPSNGPSYYWSGLGILDPLNTAKFCFSKDGTSINGSCQNWNQTADSFDTYTVNNPGGPYSRVTGRNWLALGGYAGLDIYGNQSFPRGFLMGNQATTGAAEPAAERLFDSRSTPSTILSSATVSGIKQGNFSFNNAPVPGGNGCWVYTSSATSGTMLGCLVSNSATKADYTMTTLRSGVSTNTDITGTIATGSGTGTATYTFTGGPYTTAPNCWAIDNASTFAAPIGVNVVSSTTTLTFTGSTTGVRNIRYGCTFLN